MRLALLTFLFAARLGACTPVVGDRILGREMAVEHSAFADIDPNIDLGPAPVAGLRRTLSYFELERIAKQHSVNLESDARREACFERSTVLLNSEILASVLHVPDLEIVDFSRNPLPTGKPEFRADGLAPSGLWRGRWLFGENRSVPIWVRVRATGLLEHSVEPEIGRGDKVRVEIRIGAVLLAFDASAGNSGHIGERVTVQNPTNGQRFRAVVEAPGKVRIEK
jgi:hypothetical protein